MDIKEFVKKYGTATTSLLIRNIAQELDKSSNYNRSLAELAEEVATNLEKALESVK